jgi:hypothetical protein
VYNASTFASSFATEAMYLYVGKVLSWDSDESPPAPEDTPAYHSSVWDKMAGAVRVTKNQVSLGITRNDWNSGTKYGVYDSANTTLASDHYVLAGTMDRDVYECLDNNGSAISTSKPSHKNLGITRERDGYAWKYMYTIPDTIFKRFATSSVIPVFQDPDVARSSVPTGIIHLPISANNTTGIGAYYRGTGYVNTSYGTMASNATIFTTVLANSYTNEITVQSTSGLSVYGNYYNNCAFLVTSGIAKGTYRSIIVSKAGAESDSGATVAFGSDGATTNKSNLVLSSVISNFANGDTFMIGPIVRGPDDKNALGFLGIGKINASGNITSIDVSQVGTGFSNGSSNATIQGDYAPTAAGATNHPDGSGASVQFMVPPSGGHGYDPFMELEAKYVIVSPETPLTKDHQTGIFGGYGNEIRQVGIVKNPIEKYTGQIANKTSYDMRTTLYFDTSASIKFRVDQRLYNSDPIGSETASGLVHSICGDSSNEYISLTDVSGSFANGDIVYNRLGDSATISSSSLGVHKYPSTSNYNPRSAVIDGGLAKYVGDILYHENISPITRRLDQKEEFKFVFEF